MSSQYTDLPGRRELVEHNGSVYASFPKAALREAGLLDEDGTLDPDAYAKAIKDPETGDILLRPDTDDP